VRGAIAVIVAVVVMLPACSHHPTPAAVDPATLPALPRSSLAAVILHRSELGLTDDQVRELEQIDQRRESEDVAVRAELAPKAKPVASSGSGSGTGNAGSGGAASPSAAPAAGASGGGMGGGHMGGMRGGRMGGGRGFRAPSNGGPSPGQRATKLEDRLDDDDTKAYLDGEEVLTEPQREQAREIASDYRAQLYDRRELLKQKAAGK